jgi:hypothetical protein
MIWSAYLYRPNNRVRSVMVSVLSLNQRLYIKLVFVACGFSYAQLRCDVAVRFVDIGGIVTRSLVLCVYFVDRCLSVCTVSFGHCVVCSSFWSVYCLLLFDLHLPITLF